MRLVAFLILMVVAGVVAIPTTLSSQEHQPESAPYRVELYSLQKKAESSSRYSVTNLSASNSANIVNQYYIDNGTLIASLSDLVPATESRTYDLAETSGIPNDYSGYAVVSADQPITATLQPGCAPGELAYCIELRGLQKTASGNSRYLIANRGVTHSNTQHGYYAESGTLVFYFESLIPVGETKTYELKGIDGIANGYAGYLTVRASMPVSGTVLPLETPTPTPTPTATPHYVYVPIIYGQIATPTPILIPHITSISPADGAMRGQVITINGVNFGDSQNDVNGNVVIAGLIATSALSWSDTVVVIPVPGNASPGIRIIQVYARGAAGNTYSYQILP